MKNFQLQKTKIFLLKKFKILPQVAIITGSGIKLFRNYKPIFSTGYSKLLFLKQEVPGSRGPEVQRSESPDLETFCPSRTHLRRARPSAQGGPASGERDLKTTITGHEGTLKLYKIKNKNVLVFSGRHHLYEGLDITDVVKNVNLAYELGIRKIIITNAAGGINKKFKPGDLMLITGFIDLMQGTERGVLSGIYEPPYKIKTKLTMKAGVKEGIYAGMIGPTYETQAEIKLLQTLGASAVGMSTIPEIICAKSLGMDYAAISVISNIWHKKHKPSHEEVLKNVKKANEKLNNLILQLLDHSL